MGREVVHLTADASVSTAVKHIPDVAERGTVLTRFTHVYNKLGLASRRQVAQQAARRT